MLLSVAATAFMNRGCCGAVMDSDGGAAYFEGSEEAKAEGVDEEAEGM